LNLFEVKIEGDSSKITENEDYVRQAKDEYWHQKKFQSSQKYE